MLIFFCKTTIIQKHRFHKIKQSYYMHSNYFPFYFFFFLSFLMLVKTL